QTFKKLRRAPINIFVIHLTSEERLLTRLQVLQLETLRPFPPEPPWLTSSIRAGTCLPTTRKRTQLSNGLAHVLGEARHLARDVPGAFRRSTPTSSINTISGKAFSLLDFDGIGPISFAGRP